VIRIEPSALMSAESVERVCRGLEDVLTALRAGDTARLLRFVIGPVERAPAVNGHRRQPAQAIAETAVGHRSQPPRHAEAKVGFLIHFSRPADLQSWETALSCFSEPDCGRFLERTKGLLHPFVLHETQVHSLAGKSVDLVVIGVPFTAAQAIESMREGDDWCLALVREGLELARERGCTVLGLGGHTSIVCMGGRSLVEDRLALTSGNSLTVAAAYQALLQAAKGIGLEFGACRLGVVGAAGNVGAALAELASQDFQNILMVSRRSAERLLGPVAQRIYADALRRLAAGSSRQGGIAQAIAETETVRKALSNGRANSEKSVSGLQVSLEHEMGEDAPISFSESMEDLRSCDLIISATNAARPVVGSRHLADRPVLVCDVAVPCDVDPAVEFERPRAKVIRGVIVNMPLGQELGIPAVPLQGSEVYGCLAETILLGFAGFSSHFSYGPLSLARIRQIGEWAAIHGFEIRAEARAASADAGL
jgi:predicted amino acid dehydrogenase